MIEIFNFSQSALVERLAIEIIVKSAALILLVFVILWIIRSASALQKSWLWKALFLFLLGIPLFTQVLPSFWGGGVFSYSQHANSVGLVDNSIVTKIEDNSVENYLGNSRSSSDGQRASETVDTESSITVQQIFLIIWLAGILLFLIVFLSGKFYIWRLRKTSEIFQDEQVNRIMLEVHDELELAKTPQILVTDLVSAAFTTGIIKPVIILPTTARKWSKKQIKSVLLHEIVHISNRDSLFELLAHLVLSLHWFNPLVWLSIKYYHVERERACDNLVLSKGISGPEYAKHLMKVAQEISAIKKPIWVRATESQGSSLKDRILWILSPGIKRSAKESKKAALMILLMTIGVFSIASFQVWTESSNSNLNITYNSGLSSNSEEKTRYTAADEAYYSSLIRLLGDPSMQVRSEAMESFAALENPFDVPGFENAALNALDDGWYVVRLFTWEALQQAPDLLQIPGIREKIFEGMMDKNYVVRANVFEAVKMLNSTDTLQGIEEKCLEALDDNWYIIRKHAIEILATIATPDRLSEIKSNLSAALKDDHPLVRVAAVKALSMLQK